MAADADRLDRILERLAAIENAQQEDIARLRAERDAARDGMNAMGDVATLPRSALADWFDEFLKGVRWDRTTRARLDAILLVLRAAPVRWAVEWRRRGEVSWYHHVTCVTEADAWSLPWPNTHERRVVALSPSTPYDPVVAPQRPEPAPVGNDGRWGIQ